MKYTVNPKTFDAFWLEHRPGLIRLIKACQSQIENDPECYADPENENIPSMQITISNNYECTTWSYQTGDNSYTGSCYGDPFWGVGYVHLEYSAESIADELINDLAEHTDFETDPEANLLVKDYQE